MLTPRWAPMLALAVLLQAAWPHFHPIPGPGPAETAVSPAAATAHAPLAPADCPACRTAKQQRTAAPTRARGVEPASSAHLGHVAPPPALAANRFLGAPAPPRAPPV